MQVQAASSGPAVLGCRLGDQGRGKGVFFQEELEVGVLGKGLF